MGWLLWGLIAVSTTAPVTVQARPAMALPPARIRVEAHAPRDTRNRRIIVGLTCASGESDQSEEDIPGAATPYTVYARWFEVDAQTTCEAWALLIRSDGSQARASQTVYVGTAGAE